MPRAKSEAERTRAVLDDIVAFTLELPDAVESRSYGKPALKRREKLIFALTEPLGPALVGVRFLQQVVFPAALVALHAERLIGGDETSGACL